MSNNQRGMPRNPARNQPILRKNASSKKKSDRHGGAGTEAVSPSLVGQEPATAMLKLAKDRNNCNSPLTNLAGPSDYSVRSPKGKRSWDGGINPTVRAKSLRQVRW